MQKNKIDELFDSIEAGDCVNIEQQNSQHLTQMKTLLDDHLAQQPGILVEFTKDGKVNIAEMRKWRVEMTRERKVLTKTLAAHEAQIDRLSSYSDGGFLARRVYNWCLGIFMCSVIIVTALITMAIFVLSEFRSLCRYRRKARILLKSIQRRIYMLVHR